MKSKELEHFEQLFYQLQPPLYAYCCKYVDDKELARDIVQECFISLWENYESVKSSYDSYLFRAVHNRCISYFRSLKVHAEYEESAKLKIREIEIHPDVPNPLTELYLKEVNDLLKKSIEKLPEKCKLIFMMSRYQGMKNQEISDMLDVSIRTVEAQIYHALKILKTELKEYLPVIALCFSSFYIH